MALRVVTALRPKRRATVAISSKFMSGPGKK
jgi:hypothetical protein